MAHRGWLNARPPLRLDPRKLLYDTGWRKQKLLKKRTAEYVNLLYPDRAESVPADTKPGLFHWVIGQGLQLLPWRTACSQLR